MTGDYDSIGMDKAEPLSHFAQVAGRRFAGEDRRRCAGGGGDRRSHGLAKAVAPIRIGAGWRRPVPFW
jgi:hypothetical protein